MKYFIYQGNDHDCGFAALKMYLATLAKDKSYLYIPKPKKREHYNLDDLAEISLSYGVELEVCGCSKDYYESLDEPTLTLIDENHVVMIKRVKKKSITLYDPGRGIVKMKKDEFLRRWRNVIMSTDSPETVSRISKIRQRLLPQKLEILNNVFSFLSAALLIATFYLLNKRENFWFSLLFLSLFIGSQIVDRVILYKQVYTFDTNYIPKYFNIKSNCSKESYAKYVSYKESFFMHNRQLIASVLIAFCVTFLLCFNDFRNAFVLLALILLKVLELLLFSKSDQQVKNEIADIENGSFSNISSAKDLALKANTKADSQIFKSSAKEIFYIFASFIFAVFMMFMTGNSGCNYVIFHFVMYFAGFNAYNNLLDGLSNKKETMKLERRFFDSCNL